MKRCLLDAPRQRVLGLLLTIFVCSAAWAQTQWSNVGTMPRVIASGAFAFDSFRDRVVCSEMTGQWEYDGTAWTQLTMAIMPVTGFGAMLAYDPVRRRSVLFGGRTMGTWEWDGLNWYQVAPRGGPIRSEAGMVYHKGRGTVILFGGVGSTQYFNDMWEWNGATWSVIQATNPPPLGTIVNPIRYHNLAYDEARDVLCVHGGIMSLVSSPGYVAMSDTYEWDAGSGWRLVSTTGPALSGWLSYYETRRCMVMVGNDAQNSSQTWERIGSGSWVQRVSAPPPRCTGPAVYDSLRHRVVAVDSCTQTTWSYAPVHPASYEAHGSGCNGTAWTPTLTRSQVWSLPWLGDTLSATIDHLPLSTAVLITGLSDTMAGSTPLPFDLGPSGMHLCWLRTSVDDVRLVVGSGGSATVQMPVPALSALLGVQFFQQAMAFDPGANSMGAVVSNSVVGVFGSR